METHKFSKNKSMPSDYWRIFANHVKLTEVPVDFTCDLCYDVFRSRKELKTHLEFHYELIKDKPDKVVENCPIEISDDDDDCAVVAKTDSNSKNQSTSKSACHKLPLQPSTALEYKEYNPKKHKRKFVNILPRPDELKKKEHISEPPKKPKKSKKSNVVQKKLKNNSSNVDSSAPNKSNFVATTENQVDGNNIVYIVNQEKSINETVQQISHSSVPMVQTNIPNNQNFGGANNNQVPNNNLVYFMNNSGPARGLGAASNMIYIIPHANVSSNNPLAIGGNNLLGQEQQNITTSISDNSASSNIIIGSKLFGQFNQNPGIITSRNSKLIFLPTTNESVSNATGSINLASSMTNNVTDMQVESSSTDAVSSTTKSNDEKLTLPAESST